MILSEGQLMFTPCNLVPDHVIVPDHMADLKMTDIKMTGHTSHQRRQIYVGIYIFITVQIRLKMLFPCIKKLRFIKRAIRVISFSSKFSKKIKILEYRGIKLSLSWKHDHLVRNNFFGNTILQMKTKKITWKHGILVGNKILTLKHDC